LSQQILAKRPGDVPARVRDRPRGDRVEAARCALSIGTAPELDQDRAPTRPRAAGEPGRCRATIKMTGPYCPATIRLDRRGASARPAHVRSADAQDGDSRLHRRAQGRDLGGQDKGETLLRPAPHLCGKSSASHGTTGCPISKWTAYAASAGRPAGKVVQLENLLLFQVGPDFTAGQHKYSLFTMVEWSFLNAAGL